MITTLKEKLLKVRELAAQFGESLNYGAIDSDISEFSAAVMSTLNKLLPRGYTDFLKEINGLEFNGYIIYGIDPEYCSTEPNQRINGLILNNQDWYENFWQKKYLFVGDSNTSWFVWSNADKRYFELEKPSGNIIREYKSFPEMFDLILFNMQK